MKEQRLNESIHALVCERGSAIGAGVRTWGTGRSDSAGLGAGAGPRLFESPVLIATYRVRRSFSS